MAHSKYDARRPCETNCSSVLEYCYHVACYGIVEFVLVLSLVLCRVSNRFWSCSLLLSPPWTASCDWVTPLFPWVVLTTQKYFQALSPWCYGAWEYVLVLVRVLWYVNPFSLVLFHPVLVICTRVVSVSNRVWFFSIPLSPLWAVGSPYSLYF